MKQKVKWYLLWRTYVIPVKMVRKRGTTNCGVYGIQIQATAAKLSKPGLPIVKVTDIPDRKLTKSSGRVARRQKKTKNRGKTRKLGMQTFLFNSRVTYQLIIGNH